jgi:hypothetical protein
MIVSFSWNRQTKIIQALDPAYLEKHPERLQDENEVIWIDLSSPTPEEEELVLVRLKRVHNLTLEDMRYGGRVRAGAGLAAGDPRRAGAGGAGEAAERRVPAAGAAQA